MKITKSAINRMQPGDVIRDDVLLGFGARYRGNSISYFLQTRAGGRLRWLTIGKHGAPWTPETARRRAREMLSAIEEGEDPTAEKSRRAERPMTVALAFERYFAEHGPKLTAKTLEDYGKMYRLHIAPALGDKPIASVAHGDIAHLHASMSAKKRSANLTLAILSAMMSWAERRGFVPASVNPCKGVKKYREEHRQRYLRQEELERLSRALDALESSRAESLYAIAAIRLLLLTGARLSEILTLEWSFVDLERGLIFLPASKTGQKPIFLSEAALQVLQALPRLANNRYVIVGAVEGAHLVNLQKPWRRIRAEAGLDDVRIHDLRHSYASFAAAGGASLPQIGALLGHKSSLTTQRYAHLTADPLHAVNASVGDMISSVFNVSKKASGSGNFSND